MFGDVVDYMLCLDLLRNVSERTGCDVHSYVLMGNHLHLLLTPQEPLSPARMMQRVGLSYVRYFNKRYGRTGTLWEGRYRSSIVNSQRYFFACSRYIELNPVRAQLAQTPNTYRWSSFHRNATGETDILVKPHPLYSELGSGEDERQNAYLSLFANHIDTDAIAVLRSGYSGRRSS